MKEYGELEKQMKKALIDIEKREKQLNLKEQEVKDFFSFSPILKVFHRFNVCKLI